MTIRSSASPSRYRRRPALQILPAQPARWRAATHRLPRIRDGEVNLASGGTTVKNKVVRSNGMLVLAIAALSLALGCGGGVKGNTYADNGNVVQLEFKSGGKAYMSMGLVTNACSYTESGKNV